MIKKKIENKFRRSETIFQSTGEHKYRKTYIMLFPLVKEKS